MSYFLDLYLEKCAILSDISPDIECVIGGGIHRKPSCF